MVSKSVDFELVRMRWFILLGLALISCLMTLAITARGQQAPAGNSANGRKLFASVGCYQCHGYEAQGSTATGPRLGPNPLPWDRLSKYVRQPSGQMPPYTAKVLPEKDLADIYAFLRSLPQPKSVKDMPLLNQ